MPNTTLPRIGLLCCALVIGYSSIALSSSGRSCINGFGASAELQSADSLKTNKFRKVVLHEIANGELDELRALPRVEIDNKKFRGLENQLEVCARSMKPCRETYQLIEKSLALEKSAYLKRLKGYEEKLITLGLSDEALLNVIDPLLNRISKCQERWFSDCSQIESQVRTLLPTETISPARLDASLTGSPNADADANTETTRQPNRSLTRSLARYQENSRPLHEIPRLTFIPLKQRNEILQIISRQSQFPHPLLIEREVNNIRDMRTPVPDLNSMLERFLGRDVKVSEEQGKVRITSNDGLWRVKLDPSERYVTTWKKSMDGDWNYVPLRLAPDGLLYLATDQKNAAKQVSLTHFSY